MSVPEFVPFARSSPFMDLVGPLLTRESGDGPEFALAIDERHLNARDSVHGGVLSALADVALGYAAATSTDPPAHLITASLCIDFVGSATVGDTLVATVDVQRVGSRLAFANCHVRVQERHVARASAVFLNATANPS
jgi:acyl-coenzyme A thioesterase 13